MQHVSVEITFTLLEEGGKVSAMEKGRGGTDHETG